MGNNDWFSGSFCVFYPETGSQIRIRGIPTAQPVVVSFLAASPHPRGRHQNAVRIIDTHRPVYRHAVCIALRPPNNRELSVIELCDGWLMARVAYIITCSSLGMLVSTTTYATTWVHYCYHIPQLLPTCTHGSTCSYAVASPSSSTISSTSTSTTIK